MIDWSKLYDEFLYDCYIANQHLTDEDWLYYGREEHHIEIPDRDGGLLTPLNTQPLTLYQHWVAGVLQSEVCSKKCFAFVPKGVLPYELEQLRVKWCRVNVKECKKGKRDPEELAKHMQRIRALNTYEHLRDEEYIAKWAAMIQAAAKEKLTFEVRSAAGKLGMERTPPEVRSERSRKGWETRRRNKQGG